jgi:hypothetical protein
VRVLGNAAKLAGEAQHDIAPDEVTGARMKQERRPLSYVGDGDREAVQIERCRF